jgi:putative glutamine amidotransferase
MTNRPVIGIIACNRNTGDEPAQSVMTRYVAAAIRYCDCAALIVPSLPELMTATEVAPRIDALLLTGSPSNVGTERYGDADPDATGPFDADRDSMVFGLIAAMIARQRPVFGICRGFQELNVALGGTLRRDLGATDLPHHAPDGAELAMMFAHTHPVALTPGGQLAGVFGGASLQVNSVHYQGIDRLAAGLQIEATAPDGVVEAFSGDIGGAPLLAVQWHPEWQTDANPQSQALFAHMGRTLRKMLS